MSETRSWAAGLIYFNPSRHRRVSKVNVTAATRLRSTWSAGRKQASNVRRQGVSGRWRWITLPQVITPGSVSVAAPRCHSSGCRYNRSPVRSIATWFAACAVACQGVPAIGAGSDPRTLYSSFRSTRLLDSEILLRREPNFPSAKSFERSEAKLPLGAWCSRMLLLLIFRLHRDSSV